jgi:DNA-binding transcriptional regulator LsrR (DeoR family)
MADETIRSVVAYWNHLTHICIGIGTLPPIAGEVIYIGEEILNMFIESGGVGDICSRYFNSAGNFINAPLYNRLIGINVEQILKTEHVLAVAAGPEKVKATASLLKANLITELFVDEDLARAIINELRK